MAKEGQIVILAYVGPETILPMTSVVAGMFGILLILGRDTLRYLWGILKAGRRGIRALLRTALRREPVGSTD
jgi:hypothetical protein